MCTLAKMAGMPPNTWPTIVPRKQVRLQRVLVQECQCSCGWAILALETVTSPSVIEVAGEGFGLQIPKTTGSKDMIKVLYSKGTMRVA